MRLSSRSGEVARSLVTESVAEPLSKSGSSKTRSSASSPGRRPVNRVLVHTAYPPLWRDATYPGRVRTPYFRTCRSLPSRSVEGDRLPSTGRDTLPRIPHTSRGRRASRRNPRRRSSHDTPEPALPVSCADADDARGGAHGSPMGDSLYRSSCSARSASLTQFFSFSYWTTPASANFGTWL